MEDLTDEWLKYTEKWYRGLQKAQRIKEYLERKSSEQFTMCQVVANKVHIAILQHIRNCQDIRNCKEWTIFPYFDYIFVSDEFAESARSGFDLFKRHLEESLAIRGLELAWVALFKTKLHFCVDFVQE